MRGGCGSFTQVSSPLAEADGIEPAHRGSLGAPVLKIESRRAELSILFVSVRLHTR
jgi:hypothetical protein